MITEFHEPRDTVTVVRASDDDDPASPNGRILFTIEGGNEKGRHCASIGMLYIVIFLIKNIVCVIVQFLLF